MFGLCLLAGVLVAGMLFPVFGALGVASNQASNTINSVTADLVTTDPPLITKIADSQGNAIAYLYDQYRMPVTSDQISPTMKAALISIEDRRFYEHHGVDWKGTIRALISNSSSEDTQGASTLTQQYVKNYLINVVYRDQVGVEADPEKKIGRDRSQEQTITRKLREAQLAIQLEQKMSKEEILTGYLNVVEFNYRVFGIGAAAQYYYNTTPDKLTVTQSATLAGMVNNPVKYDPWKRPEETLKRRNRVIDTMVDTNRLSAEDAAAAKKEALGVVPEPTRPAANCVGAGPEYGFFCQYVEDYLMKIGMFSQDQLYAGGYTIKTTFDARATQIAKGAVERQVPKTTAGIANTMAIIKPGKERHEVVAMVANRDYGLNGDLGQTTIGYPYGVMNKFGAGSTFKIFTAAAYLERGGGINHQVDVPPTYTSNVFTGGGKTCPRTERANDGDTRKYCVKNGGDYPGRMTLQQALADSPNTSFVILEEQVGMDLIVDMASRLGLRETMATNQLGQAPDPSSDNADLSQTQSQHFRSTPNGNPGNASFTLGPGPVSTLEMANVGATLMSGGVWCPPSPLVEVLDRNGKKLDISQYEEPCEQAVPEPLANTMVQGMSRDDIDGTAAGAADQFGWTRPMLGKTGTTQQYKSAAFVGATPQFAASTMTFNDSPRPQGICDGAIPRLCGTGGNIYGGRVPARTWFDAMNGIHEGLEVAQLPPGDPRYINGGDESKVPDVVGKSEADATTTLQNAGYQVAVRKTNRADPKGQVVNQSPRGAALPGGTITIYVSTGYVPPAQPEQPPDPSGGGTPPPSGPGG
jgi:membrane peptidoglycan carboxypeptidase